MNNLKEALAALSSASLIQTMSEENDYIKEIISLKDKIISLQDEIDDVVRVLNYGGYFLNETTKRFEFDDTDTSNAIYHLNHITADWVQGCADFQQNAKNCSTILKEEVNKSTQAFRFSYDHYQNSVSLLNTGTVQLKGGLSMFIGLAAGMVLGFVISTLIVSSIEIHKKDDKKEE